MQIVINTDTFSHLSKKRFRSVMEMYLNKKNIEIESFVVQVSDAKKTKPILTLRQAVLQADYMASACRFEDTLSVLREVPDTIPADTPVFKASTALALKIVTSTLLALLNSHRTSAAHGSTLFYQFESDLIKERGLDRILSGFFKVESILAFRFCYSGPPGLLDIGIRPTPQKPPNEQKRKLIKFDRRGVVYEGDSRESRILSIQIPVDAVQFEKLCTALSRRRRKSEFYFRASFSKERLRKILTSQYRKALKEKRERGFGIFTLSLQIEKGISSRMAVAELIQSGALKDKISQIEVGFNQSALGVAVRFSEYKNVGTKARPMYQRLDTRDIVGKIPPIVAVCNKLVSGNG